MVGHTVCITIAVCMFTVMCFIDSIFARYYNYKKNYDDGITSNLNKQIEFNKWKIKNGVKK